MKQAVVIGGFVLALAAAAPAWAQQQTAPYTTTTKDLADRQTKESAELNAKLAKEKAKRKACRADAKAQKIAMTKRRAFMKECMAK